MSAKLENMISKSGNKIPNQYIIENGKDTIFQSYETTIAMIHSDQSITIDNNALDYSKTTSKYLYSFLDMNRKEITDKVNNGEILITKLN